MKVKSKEVDKKTKSQMVQRRQGVVLYMKTEDYKGRSTYETLSAL